MEYLALYRKYRPSALEEMVVVQSFGDLPHQGNAKKTYRVIDDKMLY